MLKLRVVTISTAMRRFSIPQHCIAAQWSDLVWGILYFILYTEVYWGILYFILYTILYSILYSLRYIIYYTLYCLSVRASLRSKSTSWDSAGGQNANICKLAWPIFVCTEIIDFMNIRKQISTSRSKTVAFWKESADEYWQASHKHQQSCHANICNISINLALSGLF